MFRSKGVALATFRVKGWWAHSTIKAFFGSSSLRCTQTYIHVRKQKKLFHSERKDPSEETVFCHSLSLHPCVRVYMAVQNSVRDGSFRSPFVVLLYLFTIPRISWQARVFSSLLPGFSPSRQASTRRSIFFFSTTSYFFSFVFPFISFFLARVRVRHSALPRGWCNFVVKLLSSFSRIIRCRCPTWIHRQYMFSPLHTSFVHEYMPRGAMVFSSLSIWIHIPVDP